MQEQTQIFGIRAVIEAVNSGETIDKVFLQKDLKGELFGELESLLNRNSINPLCILNNAYFNIVNVSTKYKLVDILNSC